MANRHIKNDLTDNQKEFIITNSVNLTMNQLCEELKVEKHRIEKFVRVNAIAVKPVYPKKDKERADGMFDYDRMYF